MPRQVPVGFLQHIASKWRRAVPVLRRRRTRLANETAIGAIGSYEALVARLGRTGKLGATCLLALATAAAVPPVPYDVNGPVERRYAADGPWRTTTIQTVEACDRKGHVCDLWFPTDLGSNPLRGMADGFRHPVIVFANGTNDAVSAELNATFLRHLASWGFVVIRSRDGATGAGDTVIDTANYVLALDRDPASPFHGQLDRDNMGLAGHSQGAGTAVRLFAEQNPLFKTYVPVATPENLMCLLALCAANPVALPKATKGSIFYVSGNLDPISPLPVNLRYYMTTASEVDKVVGMIGLGSHLEIEGTPHCRADALPATCNIGLYPLLGYPTAWFMWKLQGATDGPAAFGKNGELAGAAPNWIGVLSNIGRSEP